jgi:HPt (histidine-containing phosphotransfer) domain-containing protein
MSKSPTLNLEVINALRELQTDEDDDVVAEIAQTFVKTTTETFKNFDEAQKAGQIDEIRIMAHTLKSATASVGAMKLCELITELEKMAKTGQKENIPKQILSAHQEFQLVLQELDKFMATG